MVRQRTSLNLKTGLLRGARLCCTLPLPDRSQGSSSWPGTACLPSPKNARKSAQALMPSQITTIPSRSRAPFSTGDTGKNTHTHSQVPGLSHHPRHCHWVPTAKAWSVEGPAGTISCCILSKCFLRKSFSICLAHEEFSVGRRPSY